jgi:GNAT superfamily N-acetyltransferase
MTPDVALRPVDAGDVDFLFDLHRASLGPYVDEVWGWWDDEQRAHLAMNLDMCRARIITVDGLDAGRLDVEEADDRVFIALLELLPSHQCRGIGTSIIRDVIARAHRESKSVTLRVLEVNHRAHALYQRLGFVETHRDGVPPEVRIAMVQRPPGLTPR